MWGLPLMKIFTNILKNYLFLNTVIIYFDLQSRTILFSENLTNKQDQTFFFLIVFIYLLIWEGKGEMGEGEVGEEQADSVLSTEPFPGPNLTTPLPHHDLSWYQESEAQPTELLRCPTPDFLYRETWESYFPILKLPWDNNHKLNSLYLFKSILHFLLPKLCLKSFSPPLCICYELVSFIDILLL